MCEDLEQHSLYTFVDASNDVYGAVHIFGFPQRETGILVLALL